MWKIVVMLLLTAAVMLAARLMVDPPVIQTRVGLAIETPTLFYGGVRG